MLSKLANQLPEHYRNLLDLRFNERYTIHETATRMNIPEGLVRRIQYRALKKLNEVVDEHKNI